VKTPREIGIEVADAGAMIDSDERNGIIRAVVRAINIERKRKPPRGMVTITLTQLQARGLEMLAGEGAEAMFNDEEAGKAYIGGPKAIEAARQAHALLCAQVDFKKKKRRDR
jgi:hypothetical protein